jgi:hypothetical protein
MSVLTLQFPKGLCTGIKLNEEMKNNFIHAQLFIVGNLISEITKYKDNLPFWEDFKIIVENNEITVKIFHSCVKLNSDPLFLMSSDEETKTYQEELKDAGGYQLININSQKKRGSTMSFFDKENKYNNILLYQNGYVMPKYSF